MFFMKSLPLWSSKLKSKAGKIFFVLSCATVGFNFTGPVYWEAKAPISTSWGPKLDPWSLPDSVWLKYFLPPGGFLFVDQNFVAVKKRQTVKKTTSAIWTGKYHSIEQNSAPYRNCTIMFSNEIAYWLDWLILWKGKLNLKVIMTRIQQKIENRKSHQIMLRNNKYNN